MDYEYIHIDKEKVRFTPTIYTKEDILSINPKLEYEKAIVENCRISIEGHFGNIVCLDIYSRNREIYGGINNTHNIGYILSYLADFFCLPQDACERAKIESLIGKEIECFSMHENRVIFIGNEKGEFIDVDDFCYLPFSQAEAERKKLEREKSH